MTQRELTPQDAIAMLRRRWLLITTLTLVGGPIGYGISRFLSSEYTSQTLVLVEQPSVPADFVRPVDSTEISQRLASMQQQILSRTRLEPIVRQFGLYAQDISRLPMEDLVAQLHKAVKVTPVLPMIQMQANRLPGFYVSVTLDNPRIAQQVCAAITSMFIDENLRIRQQHSEDTTQFLAQQLAEAKAKLDEQDAKLAAFKASHMGELPDEAAGNMNVLMTMTTQLDAVTQALTRAQQDKSFNESLLAQQVSDWKASQMGGSPETLEKQLAAQQTELSNLQARYTDDYPDVIKAKNDIAALKKRIAGNKETATETSSDPDEKKSAEPPQITAWRAQIHSLNEVIAEKMKEAERLQTAIKVYQERVHASPAIEQQYKDLTRDYQTAEGFYNDLLRKRDQSAMATDLERRQQGEQFRVFDPANLPDKPSFPNRPLFAFGGFGVGLSLGLGLAFVRELRDTSLKSERDVELFLHLPVLAMLPDLESTSGKKPKRAVRSNLAKGMEQAARS
jgi:polysaccharide chain length determinant protein (PEP-CTERM system associated)